MFKALARLDSFIALSDSWEGRSLRKGLQTESRKLYYTETKGNTMHVLHKYGSTKHDILQDGGYMSAGTRQTGRFVSIREAWPIMTNMKSI